MIPNNTKSGIISIIRFSGEKKHSTFSAASTGGILAVNADGKMAKMAEIGAALTGNRPQRVFRLSTRKFLCETSAYLGIGNVSVISQFFPDDTHLGCGQLVN